MKNCPSNSCFGYTILQNRMFLFIIITFKMTNNVAQSALDQRLAMAKHCSQGMPVFCCFFFFFSDTKSQSLFLVLFVPFLILFNYVF